MYDALELDVDAAELAVLTLSVEIMNVPFAYFGQVR
jgi:hypothetical protein